MTILHDTRCTVMTADSNIFVVFQRSLFIDSVSRVDVSNRTDRILKVMNNCNCYVEAVGSTVPFPVYKCS